MNLLQRHSNYKSVNGGCSCSNCGKNIIDGTLKNSLLFCDKCINLFRTCNKCRTYNFYNGKCMKCNHSMKTFKCDICGNLEYDVIVQNGAIACTRKCHTKNWSSLKPEICMDIEIVFDEKN